MPGKSALGSFPLIKREMERGGKTDRRQAGGQVPGKSALGSFPLIKRERELEGKRQTDRQREREKEKEREMETDRDRDRGRESVCITSSLSTHANCRIAGGAARGDFES